jgi:hypothetical protein
MVHFFLNVAIEYCNSQIKNIWPNITVSTSWESLKFESEIFASIV